MSEAPTTDSEPSSTSFRAHITVVFCDLCNSTKLAKAIEPEEYSDLLDAIRNEAYSAANRHGGSIIRIDGDGFIFVFGYPELHTNSTLRAIEAAIDMHTMVEKIGATAPFKTLELNLHSGIHSGIALIKTGDIVRGRFEILGDPTNVTARLCDFAGAGEIIISDATLGDNRDRYEFSDCFRVDSGGRPEGLPARKLIGRKQSNKSLQETRHTHSTVFAGRQSELDWLSRRFINDTPRTGLFAIVAEAGMGKSRLLYEFHRKADTADSQIYRVSCETYLDSNALRPVRDLTKSITERRRRGVFSIHPVLQRLFSPQSEAVTKPQTSELAQELLNLLLEDRTQEHVILIFDDWHWVDELTENVVGRLVELAEDDNLSIIIASRPKTSHSLIDEADEVLELPPLNKQSIRSFVNELVDIADPALTNKIATLSGGNPLYISELCHVASSGDHALDIAQKETWLHTLTNARLKTLDAEQLDVVQAAAVIGFTVSKQLLKEICNIKEQDEHLVQSLQKADFLFPDEQTGFLVFKHGLTRNAVYNLTNLRKRKSLHRKIAEALTRTAAASSDHDWHNQLAFHYSGSEQHHLALKHAMISGEQALATSALDRAQSFFIFAYKEFCKAPNPDFTLQEILHKFGIASIVDPSIEQIATLENIIAWAKENHDPVAAAWGRYWMAFIYYGVGQPKNALDHFLISREEALQSKDQKLVSRVTASLGKVYAAACDYKKAVPALSHSVAIQFDRYNISGNPVALVYSKACLGFTLADQGLFNEAMLSFTGALELLEGRLHEVELSVRAYYGAALMWKGDLADAEETWSWVIKHASQMRSRYHYMKAKALHAIAQYLQSGDPEQLETAAKIADIANLPSQQRFSLVHGFLAENFAQLGDFDRTKHYSAKAFRRARQGDTLGETQALRAMAIMAHQDSSQMSEQHFLIRAEHSAQRRQSKREILLNRYVESLLKLGAPSETNSNAHIFYRHIRMPQIGL